MADRPTHRDIPNLVITPEMIDAGYATLLASGRVDEPIRADKVLVAEIFESMWRARQV
jgi:hypothetical protein